MKVSIIICAYNEEEKIARCIDSVRAQTHSDWELWVVDDGSTDNTAEIVKKYGATDGRIHLYSQENQGPSSARKSGIKCATGEYLTCIDADDYVGELYLEHLLEGQKLYPDVNCIIGGYKSTRAYSHPHSKDFCILPTLLAIEHPSHFYMIWAKLWKTSFMKEYVDLFPKNMNFSEDDVAMYLLYPHLINIAFVPYTDYYYIRQANRLSTQIISPNTAIQIYSLTIPALQHPFWENSIKGQLLQSNTLLAAITRIIQGSTNLKTSKEYIKQLPTLKMPKISHIKDYKLGVFISHLLFSLKCYSLLIYLHRKVFN